MLVRKLSFFETVEGRENFSLLYQGFLTGGNGPQAKTMEVVRRESKVLDKLESISEEPERPKCDACGQMIGPAGRQLKSGIQTLALEQPEFELLKKYFQATPWTVRMSRQIVHVSDWLDSITPESEGG